MRSIEFMIKIKALKQKLDMKSDSMAFALWCIKNTFKEMEEEGHHRMPLGEINTIIDSISGDLDPLLQEVRDFVTTDYTEPDRP